MRADHSFTYRLSEVASWLSTAGAVISGTIFALMTLLVLTEVILRTFFDLSTLVASEYSGYALSAMIYLGLAFSFKEGAHIRITFLNERIHGVPKFFIEIFCHLLVAVLCALSSVYMWDMFMLSKARNMTAYTVAETPLYIPQLIVFIGLCLLTLQIIARLLYILFSGPKAVDGEAAG